jgi:hypothetical protein
MLDEGDFRTSCVVRNHSKLAVSFDKLAGFLSEVKIQGFLMFTSEI